MTRIGVFSDSHGDRDALERLLEEMGHVDAACFLGDISSDAMFLREKLEEMPHQPVLYAVRGNNDLASMLPDQLLIELGGHKIWMEHGHLVPNLMTLAFRAKDHGADIALFGHTHERAPACCCWIKTKSELKTSFKNPVYLLCKCPFFLFRKGPFGAAFNPDLARQGNV